MRSSMAIGLAFAALAFPLASVAQERGPAKPPPPLLREVVQGMPKREKQEVRVVIFHASDPNTPFHDVVHH